MNPRLRKREARRGILAAGHWIVDHVKRIDRWPEPATLARIVHREIANGGFAFNLLSDLAAMDPACPLFGAGLIGDDANGRFIRERCRELKIDDAGLRETSQFPTSFTDVMTEKDSGRRTFFYCCGANEGLSEKDLPAPASLSAKIFCLGYLGFLPNLDAVSANGLNASARLLKKARAAGMMTAADLVSAPNPELRAQVTPCLPHLDILFLNEWEAAHLLGVNPPEFFDAAKAKDVAQAVRALGVRGTVVLHCREGVVAAMDEGTWEQGSVNLPEIEIQGSVGAGDALAAGVLLARYHDMAWRDALELGVCAAAACLKSPTASDGMMPWKKCLALGKKFGFNRFPRA